MDQEQDRHTWECFESQLLDELQMFLSNTGSYSAQNYFKKYSTEGNSKFFVESILSL